MTAKSYSFQTQGGRTGILLIHGLCGSPAEMRFVANALSRAGYTVSCPQLAGHCAGERTVSLTSWQDWYASAQEALLVLRETCDTVFVGGLSTGAVLSLLLAARHTADVRGLILLAPTLFLSGWLVPWYFHLFRLIQVKRLANLFRFDAPIQNGIKDRRIRQFIEAALNSGADAALRKTPGGVALEHRRLVKVVRQVVPSIQKPTMIIHPREDDYAGLGNVGYLQRHLSGLVDTVVLDDSYHIVTIDRQRHLVASRILGFLAREMSSTTPVTSVASAA